MNCKNIKSIAELISNINEIDFQYILDIECEQEYDCEAYECDDYCRCGTIVSTKINTPLFSLNVFTGLSPQDNQLIVNLLNEILSEDDFNVSIDSGYYGQELGKCMLVSKQKLLEHDKIKLLLPFI